MLNVGIGSAARDAVMDAAHEIGRFGARLAVPVVVSLAAAALPAHSQQVANADADVRVEDSWKVAKARCEERANKGDVWARRNPLQCAENEQDKIHAAIVDNAKQRQVRGEAIIACATKVKEAKATAPGELSAALAKAKIAKIEDITKDNVCEVDRALRELKAESGTGRRADAALTLLPN